MIFGLFKQRSRTRVRARPFPEAWNDTLLRIPYCRALPEAARGRLRGHIQILVNEKHFEGCGGFIMTDEARVTIAAFAGILVLERDTDYYPDLRSILVYPETFFAERHEEGDDGVVMVGDGALAGESWDRGVVALAWDEVVESARRIDGYNVVIHEFAHQLDDEDGVVCGAGEFARGETARHWAETFHAAYADLNRDVRRRRRTVIDDYGAESPEEFFAVVTETFFELPGRLKRAYPELYELLKVYYRQDPLEYFDAS